MLKTITQLVPFGDDREAQNICGYYLANMGWVGRSLPIKYEYIIGYYEVPSEFNDYKQTEKFLVIPSWDRSKSNFDLLQEIFEKDAVWVDSKYLNGANLRIAIQMRFRAVEDNLFGGEDAKSNS